MLFTYEAVADGADCGGYYYVVRVGLGGTERQQATATPAAQDFRLELNSGTRWHELTTFFVAPCTIKCGGTAIKFCSPGHSGLKYG